MNQKRLPFNGQPFLFFKMENLTTSTFLLTLNLNLYEKNVPQRYAFISAADVNEA